MVKLSGSRSEDPERCTLKTLVVLSVYSQIEIVTRALTSPTDKQQGVRTKTQHPLAPADQSSNQDLIGHVPGA